MTPPTSSASRPRSASPDDRSPLAPCAGCNAVVAAGSLALVIRDCNARGHGRPAVRAHAHRLLALELLALRLESRSYHHLGALEVADVLVAAGRHRCAEGAHQVKGAVVLLRGAEEDLLQGPVLGGRHPGASRQR